MSQVHPSEALLARFELDRMTCELVPSSSLAGMRLPKPGVTSLAVAAITLASGFGTFALIEPEAAIPFAVVAFATTCWLPILSLAQGRRIELSLTAGRLEIIRRSHGRVTSRRAFELAQIRSVYVAPAGHQTPPMLRIVSEDDEVWLQGGGVPAESLQWLADETNRAVAAARDRDADGPPLELEQLLSDSTRAARDRALRQQAARRERAT